MHSLISGSWTSQWSDVAPTLVRVAVGLVFAMHGWQKLTTMGVDGVTGFLGGLGFPMAGVFAVILIAVELLGGIALILGAFTYLAAALTSIVAAVALFAVHISRGFFANEGGFEFILLILAAAVSVMLTGPGKWSVDRIMRR